jgi:hypothetical protein
MSESGNAPQTLIRLFEAAKVMPSRSEVERRIDHMRRANAGKSPRDLSRQAIRGHTFRLTGTGVVASLPGALPVVGTAIQLGVTGATITAELWAVLRGLATMQLTVAGLHGHDVFAPERWDELVIVWGLETGAIVPATEAGKRLGTKIAVKQFNEKVSAQVFKKINQKLGTTVVTKWGTKRGGVAVGRLIPFGVGAAVGGGANYLTVRGFGGACLKFYGDIEPGNGHIFVSA